MRFLVDAQLPPALARWLSGRGYAADHVADHGLAAAADAEIWNHAMREGAVIITKDVDFAQRRALASWGPVVVWVRLPNTRRRDLLVWFDLALPGILAALDRGETLIEIV